MAKVVNNSDKKFVTKDIIGAMAEKSSADGEVKLTKKEAGAAIKYFEDVITEMMATGASIQLTGFLTISPSYRAARTGNDIMTKKPIDIPESVVATAKAGKQLKDAMKDMDKSVIESIKKAQKSK